MPDLHERFRALDRITFPHAAPDFRSPRRADTSPTETAFRTRVGVVALALVSTAATIVLVAVAFGGAGSGERSGTSPAPVAPAATNGRLAFNCGDHVCTVNADGTDQIDLFVNYEPTDVVAGYYPQWSPDGTELAFSGYDRRGSSSGGGANYDIFVMNADGSALRNVTTSAHDVAAGASQGSPVWSPDGSMIAFGGDDGRTDGLFVVNADGSGLSRIADSGYPAWSPDGSRILLSGKSHDGSDLFSMAPDGSDLVQITSGPGLDRLPSWSPDGSRIAFLRTGEDGDRIIVTRADGTGETTAFQGAAEPYYPPAWSPDGTQLAFEAGTSGNYSVWIAQVDGSGAADLTPGSNREEHTPVWSPDGQQIAFEGSEVTGVDNTGSYRVYTVNADGTGERVLTDDETSGFSLAWQRGPGSGATTAPTGSALGLSKYTDPLGWTVDYPSDWIVTPFVDHTKAFGQVSGAAISNMPMSQDASGYPGVRSDGSFTGGVAVVISHVEGSAYATPERDDSTFPLEASRAQGIPGGETLSSTLSFRANGVDYTATFGNQDGSPSDLRALDEVIRSLRVPALAEGQRAGEWLSVGPAENYPDGRGSPNWAGPLGVIYVMRGPEGIYALDLDPDSCGEGENESWDERRLEVLLICPGGTQVRFERDGTPVAGNPPAFREPLQVRPVITAWNGNLLVNLRATEGGIAEHAWP